MERRPLAPAGASRPRRTARAAPAGHEQRKPRCQRLLGPLLVAGALLLKFGKVGAAAAAEGQVPDDLGVDARLGRRLRAHLGLEVRGRLRRAAVRPRDGPRHPAAARGRQGERAGVHPVPRRGRRRALARRQRARRGARRPRRADPRLARLPRARCRSGSPPASDFWQALAFTGFFLNLFNLLPVVPLDGGRAMAAMAPWMWFVGLFAMLVLLRASSRTRSSS